MSGVALSLSTINQTPPADNDVVAGWTAFAVFLLLVAATVVICWSMVRQFRKVEANRKAGVYGEDAKQDRPLFPEKDDEPAEPTKKS